VSKEKFALLGKSQPLIGPEQYNFYATLDRPTSEEEGFFLEQDGS